MRLDKLLATQGFGTRSEVRALIRAGRVSVNGVAARDAGHIVDPAQARIAVDGEAVGFEQALTIMLNKPAGVLTAARDQSHETVLDLLPKKVADRDCMPVGRLDIDTEGLLLLTTDGQLAHRLLSPRRHVDKVYEAEVDMPLVESDVLRFAEGLQLSDFRAMPAELVILPGGLRGRVTLQEGKFHQVKRMFLSCGKRVVRLRRLSFAGITLDPALAPGAWRALTDDEVRALKRACQMG